MPSQPIRDRGKIERMKIELKKSKTNGQRNYMIFYLGINSGLRISDILGLKAGQVRNAEYIIVKEKKTKKNRRIKLNRDVREVLMEYTANMEDDDFIFKSRQGGNHPITRVQAYRILTDAAEKLGLSDISTHTMRKTMGYWHYKRYQDVAILQKIFNHSAPSITLLYIGITQDEIDNTFEDFSL